MRGTTRLASCLALALVFVGSSPGRTQDPCTLMPYDGSNENGLGAAPGFVIEYCSEMAVPAVCMDGGNYFINAVQIEATQTNGDTTMPFTAQVRRAIISPILGPITPNAIVAGPVDDVATGVPPFDQSQSWVTTTLDPLGRFSVGYAAIQLTSACAILDGTLTPDQFLGTDESLTTPINSCWKGDPPAPPVEDCRVGAPNLRSLRVGLKVSPFGGAAEGSQEVPPVVTGATGMVRLGPVAPGSTNFWIEVVHNVANPTGAHIHNAPAGMNGPIVLNLGDPTSPILLPTVDVTDLLGDLVAGDLYVNVHSTIHPGGELRSQINQASTFIFSDGFESGDTSAWSSKVP